jgi:hypothetical protein
MPVAAGAELQGELDVIPFELSRPYLCPSTSFSIQSMRIWATWSLFLSIINGKLSIELRSDLAGILAMSEAGKAGAFSPEEKALRRT